MLQRFDRWMRRKAEARWGPMIEWRISKWLQTRGEERGTK
jgi:hypothetical protein